jgi:hypothetical protein
MMWIWFILSILMIPVYRACLKSVDEENVSDIIREAEEIIKRSNGGK